MSEASSLLSLQETDLQLMRLRTALASMPQKAKLATIAKAKRKLASQLTQVVGQRKDIEMELKENEDLHDEVMAKQEAVKAEASERAANYRRVQDLDAHLSALAKRQEKLEFSNADIRRRLERLQDAEAKAREVGQRLLDEERATKQSFDEGSADLKARLAELEREREGLVGQLGEDILARYEAAVKRFGGLAVEELGSNVPSICRVTLQPSLFAQVSRGPEITECPYCHRMLVVLEHWS